MIATNMKCLKTVWKLIALVTVVAIASSVSVTSEGLITEEMELLGKKGTLRYGVMTEGQKAELFKKFESKNNRNYANKREEKKRYNLFQESLLRIDNLNDLEKSRNGSAIYGITTMADLSLEEFAADYLSERPAELTENERRSLKASPHVEIEFTDTLRDWTGILTTPIKDQGQCASCWAVSGVAQIESDAIRMGLMTPATSLSTQQMAQCTYPDRPGCTGGDTYVAYQYIRSTGGITTAAEYAYNIYDRRCDNSKRNFLLTVTEAYFVSGEAAILSHIMNYGPLSVYLDATTMYYYTGGIFDACPTNLNINHGASIVGVNLNERYWILRNTWGTQWGEQGYMRLRMGDNKCGIETRPMFVNVARV